MEQRNLGATGLRVGRIGLGTMAWALEVDDYDARDLVQDLLDAGGCVVDTADAYADGASERLLGQLLATVVPREELVIVSKSGSRPNTERRFDASRHHLLAALDGSLARLGTDHVDVWLVNAWDPLTPLDETLSALATAIASGRARYAGVSNYAGWQLATAVARGHATTGALVTAAAMEYSLLERGIEREVVPAALASGVGLLAWSPLGRGVLTGKYRHGTPRDSRATSGHFGGFVSAYLTDSHARVADAVAVAADGLGATPAEVAVSWLVERPGVAAALVGCRTAAQLVAAIEGEALVLPPEIRSALDDVSAPARGYPDHGWNQRTAGG